MLARAAEVFFDPIETSAFRFTHSEVSDGADDVDTLQVRLELPVRESRPSVRRGARRAWVNRLTRPLAADEHRARFWREHVRIGVVLTEITGVLVILYALLAHRPHRVAICLLVGFAVAATPALLALPIERLSLHPRAPLFFYAWSVSITAVIAAIALIDGGAKSPLTWLLMLTLAYAGLAYPPLGVAVMGMVMIGTYLAIASIDPPPAPRMMIVCGTLVGYTAMTVWASRHQWDLHDQQRLLAQRLETLANTDALTGCLNRRAFEARLERSCASAAPDDPVVLCVLDLDGFKQVNDRNGHAAGDAVLVAVAQALRAAVRETDSVSRLGGDEFAILLTGPQEAPAELLCARLVRLVREIGAASGVTASIGAATATTPVPADTLLRLADEAMYAAKTGGRDDHRIVGGVVSQGPGSGLARSSGPTT